MNYCNIKYNDIADGEGVRTTLFVSGCTNRCKGCFQPETWDFSYGEPFTKETEDVILESLEPSYIDGLTLLGGEPFEPENQLALLPFVRRVKERFPEKTVWAFTGFVYDRDLVDGGRKHTPDTDELLRLVDILVDGPYMEERRSLMLQFRGSENQRVIDMQKTLVKGEVVLWDKLVR
ncbi:anaerobic ribonucleoside-triphosphate reductase activating protein [uncultured Ruminococcus sp.]|uniref:anaerobic ribonucleoside-triphosphate reductase activating protein n=1 Tax=uncultured Ruminococcus sp. TaxID=165186 RepID=UPI00292E8D9E|nr:anaerobic ribonucleoside-triphosphate reductase activating protein [uncultured Ruminococcus sp.]